MHRLIPSLLLLAGCAGPTPPDSPPSTSSSTIAERLRSERLSGHVVVANGSVHGSEPLARADAAPSRAARALTRDDVCDTKPPFSTWTVVADRGGVVEVEARSDDAGACQSSWLGVRGFVRRQDLVPVLRTAVRVEHPDKSGVVFAAGAPVDWETRGTWHPHFSVDASAVAMSVPLVEKVPALPALASFQNGCEAAPPVPRAPERDMLGSSGERPCYLVGEAVEGDAPPTERDLRGELRVAGTAHAQHRLDEIAVHARAGDDLLVTLSSSCGSVRGFVARRMLSEQAGIGCGRGGGGAQAFRLFSVRHPAVATWTDGRPAGATLKNSPLLEGVVREEGGRACVSAPPLAELVCFPVSALGR